jgi:hypothetical protein
MPFRHHTDLDKEALDIMAMAYDDACRILGITGDDPRSSSLAIAIATAARAGERDRARLVECGIGACSNSKQT